LRTIYVRMTPVAGDLQRAVDVYVPLGVYAEGGSVA
jgi:hypothetical protein